MANSMTWKLRRYGRSIRGSGTGASPWKVTLLTARYLAKLG